MASLVNIPTYILDNISLINIPKSRKIYYILLSFIFIFAEKTFSERFYCRAITLLNFTKVKITFKDNFFIVRDNYGKFFYTNKRFTRMLRGIEVFSEHLAAVYLINKVKFYENDTVIDCGANVGELIPFFSKSHNNIEYIGFEPDAEIFQALEKNFVLKKGKIYQTGLSDNEGIQKLYIDSTGADTSLEKSDSDTYSNVQVKKLDSYNFQKVKLIKIDGEGHELEILHGAAETLKRTMYVTIDHGPEKGINNLRTTPEVYLYMIKNNFEPILTSSAREITLFKNTNL